MQKQLEFRHGQAFKAMTLKEKFDKDFARAQDIWRKH